MARHPGMLPAAPCTGIFYPRLDDTQIEIALLRIYLEQTETVTRQRHQLVGGEADQDSLLAWWVIIGTLPAILVGFLLQGPIEEKLRSPWIVALASIIFCPSFSSTRKFVSFTSPKRC